MHCALEEAYSLDNRYLDSHFMNNNKNAHHF